MKHLRKHAHKFKSEHNVCHENRAHTLTDMCKIQIITLPKAIVIFKQKFHIIFHNIHEFHVDLFFPFQQQQQKKRERRSKEDKKRTNIIIIFAHSINKGV